MSEAEQLEFPQVYKNDEGAEIIALNEIQGSAFVSQGFKPAGVYTEKKPAAK